MNKLVIFLLLGLTNICLAQGISFESLSTESGLSHNSITSIYQDNKGSIWIGTREGLNRYNGNRVQQFKATEFGCGLWNEGNVKAITGDGKGKIFILANEGISTYEQKSGQFTLLVRGNFHQISFINGILWIMDRKEIFTYDFHTSKKRTYFSLPESSLSLNCFLLDNTGQLWIGTEKGGLLFKEKKSRIVQKIIDSIHVTQIYQDAQHGIWVGSWNDGFFRIIDGKIRQYKSSKTIKNSISSNFVRCFMEDNDKNIWIGSFRGLDKFQRDNEQITRYGDERGGLTNSSIWNIIKDRQGTIWVGTYFGGVNYFNPKYEIYTYFRKSNIKNTGLSSSVVARMTEDNNKNLWICTEGGGLNRYNLLTHKFEWFRHDEYSNSISQDNLKSIYFDSKRNVLWIGTHLGGLNRMDLATRKFKHYQKNEQLRNSLPSNIILDIVPYQDKLILATPLGVCEFDPDTGHCRMLLNTDAFSLLIDREGVLWVGGIGSGVFAYHFDTGAFKHYNSELARENTLSGNFITRILQDRSGHLWFATASAGLCLFQSATDDFKRINLEVQGIASNTIYDIEESSTGNLLIGTNQSFATYNPQKKSFHDYRFNNGFPLGALNENSLYLSRDGSIFLGGMKGMVAFREEDLIVDQMPYALNLEQLTITSSISNAETLPNVLTKNLYNRKEIILKSDQNTFDIEWVTDNYVKRNMDEIVYNLKGFTDKWIRARINAPINYTNLAPGSYTLIVKTLQAKGPQAQLEIIILPPFYRSTAAYVIYMLFILLTMYYIGKFYRSRIKLQESLHYEQLHAKESQLLSDSKINFFTNVSHEFRTPLTLISIQVEQMLSGKGTIPAELFKKISTINSYSRQLEELVTELMDFRKHEQGLYKIYPKNVELTAFLTYVFKLFRPFAAIKKIDFCLIFNARDLNASIDSRQMQKVLNNLLSNAFKNTPEGGKIAITMSEFSENAIIEVEDSGQGIPAHEIDKIFEPFYQTSDSVIGTGIGLSLARGIVQLHHGKLIVDSHEGIGTKFTISIPLNLSAQENNIDLSIVDQFDIPSSKPPIVLHEENIITEISDVEIDFSKRKKILIVEDNTRLKAMLASVFAEFYEVVHASDGLSGWDMARNILPDLIVSDIVMPGLSGVEMCKKLKNDYFTSHIPIILLTARASIEHSMEGLLVGADDYISKPFSTKILLTRCNNLINNRLLLQEKFSKQPAENVQILATTQIDENFLLRATSIIENNIANPNFNVNIFSREMGIARTNLFSKLKGITGQTPNEFTLTIRLKKAASILKTDPQISISEISEKLGFTSAKYFSKCFKDVYQITPFLYRKQFFNN